MSDFIKELNQLTDKYLKSPESSKDYQLAELIKDQIECWEITVKTYNELVEEGIISPDSKGVDPES